MFYTVPLQITIGWWWNHFALVGLTNVLLGWSVGAICNRRCLLFDSIYCRRGSRVRSKYLSDCSPLLQQKKGPWCPRSFIWARVYFDCSTDYLKLACYSPRLCLYSPALLRFLAPAKLYCPHACFRAIQDGWGWAGMGDLSIWNGPLHP